MDENSETLLRHILEEPFPNEMQSLDSVSVDKDNFEKLQDAYGACAEESKIKEKGSGPLLDLLGKIEELYPAHRPDLGTTKPSSLLKFMQKTLSSRRENQLSEALEFMMSVGIEAMFSMGLSVRLSPPHEVLFSFVRLTAIRPTRGIQTQR